MLVDNEWLNLALLLNVSSFLTQSSDKVVLTVSVKWIVEQDNVQSFYETYRNSQSKQNKKGKEIKSYEDTLYKEVYFVSEMK